MKRVLMLMLCLMLMVPMMAHAEPAPFSAADIAEMRNNGMTTVNDYITALNPSEITWYFEGEATGCTCFTLIVDGGSVTLSVVDAIGYQDDEAGYDGATSLSGDVLDLEASFIGANWETEALSAVKLPRGLKLGDSKSAIEATLSDVEFIELAPDESEDIYDVAGSCLLTLPEGDEDGWHEYFGIDFFLKDDVVVMAQMWYTADAE